MFVVCAVGAAEKLPDVTFYYDFPPETQFYDQPLVYMEPNVIKPLNGIPAATLKQRIVHGAKMRPGSWKAMETA